MQEDKEREMREKRKEDEGRKPKTIFLPSELTSPMGSGSF